MPYNFPQYVSPTSHDSEAFANTISNNTSSSLSPSRHQTFSLQQQQQHQQQQQQQQHMLNFSQTHHHQAPSSSLVPTTSAYSSSSSSASSSSSSLSSPTSSSSPSAAALSVSPLPPPPPTSNIYSFASTSSTPPPPPPPHSALPFTKSSDTAMLLRKESEESEMMYPLDLSVRPGPRNTVCSETDAANQSRTLASRQRTVAAASSSRLGDSRHKHHHACAGKACSCGGVASYHTHNGGGSSSNVSGSSRAQQRLSPYPVPLMAPGGAGHFPSSSPSSSSVLTRSPIPLRTDSPIYGRRRTPSPAYYNSLIPNGGYRSGVVGTTNGGLASHSPPHLQQQYLPAAPTHLSSCTAPPRPHLTPSPSTTAVRSETTSSPSPFQILTTSDNVLHGAPPPASGLFRPYQDQMDADATGENGAGGVSGAGGQDMQGGELSQHQQEHSALQQSQHHNHDPRRQALRQLQLSQQRQQQQEQEQQQTAQQEEEEEEITYMDLDCCSGQAPPSAYPPPDKRTSSSCLPSFGERQPSSMISASAPSVGTDSAMEETSRVTSTVGSALHRQSSLGFAESSSNQTTSGTHPFYSKSSPGQQEAQANTHERHQYLRQAFQQSPTDQVHREAPAGSKDSHRLSHQQLQQHISSQQDRQQEYIVRNGKDEPDHHIQHHEQREIPSVGQGSLTDASISASHVTTTTSTATSDGNSSDANDNNSSGSSTCSSSDKDVSQDVLEEAKLMAFLSKTTLFTLKHDGDIASSTGHSAGDMGSLESYQRGSIGNVFQKDLASKATFRDGDGASVASNEDCGKLPSIDSRLPQAIARAGTPSSCQGSLIGRKRICFRLVDLVGLLVEQSLRA